MLSRALHAMFGYSDRPTALQFLVYIATIGVTGGESKLDGCERDARAAAIKTRASSRSAGSRRCELQRDPVHAVSLAGGRRAVVEHVAEMAAAAAAMHLGARQDQGVIVRCAHRILDRRVEARPPGAAVE